MLPFKRKNRKRRKGRHKALPPPTPLILCAIHKACFCGPIQVGFIFQQSESTAQNPPAERLRAGVPVLRGQRLKSCCSIETQGCLSIVLHEGSEAPSMAAPLTGPSPCLAQRFYLPLPDTSTLLDFPSPALPPIRHISSETLFHKFDSKAAIKTKRETEKAEKKSSSCQAICL